MLSRINGVFSKNRINISGEYLMTNARIGYVVIDVEANERSSRAALKSLSAIEGTIRDPRAVLAARLPRRLQLGQLRPRAVAARR